MYQKTTIITRPVDETQRAKRFRTLQVPTAFLGNVNSKDIKAITEVVTQHVSSLVDSFLTEPCDDNPKDMSLDTKIALHDAAYCGSLMALKQLASTYADTNANSTSLATLITTSATYGALFANSSYLNCNMGPLSRIEVQSFVDALVKGGLAIVFENLPVASFDPDAQERTLTDDLLAQVDELKQQLEESNIAQQELRASLAKQETKTSKLQQDYDAAVSAKDAKIDELQSIIDDFEDRIAKERQQTDDARRLAEDNMRQATIAQDEFAAKLKNINMIPDLSQPTDNMWREVLTDGSFLRFRSSADVIHVCQMVYDRELVFSNKAIKDANDYDGNPDEMWELLVTLVSVFLPTCRQGRPMESRQFENATNFGMTPNESKATENTKRLIKQRQAVIDGKTVTATHHAKGASIKSGKTLRIYFAYDEATRKLDIIRCGDHLDTSGSKKKGY